MYVYMSGFTWEEVMQLKKPGRELYTVLCILKLEDEIGRERRKEREEERWREEERNRNREQQNLCGRAIRVTMTYEIIFSWYTNHFTPSFLLFLSLFAFFFSLSLSPWLFFLIPNYVPRKLRDPEQGEGYKEQEKEEKKENRRETKEL